MADRGRRRNRNDMPQPVPAQAAASNRQQMRNAPKSVVSAALQIDADGRLAGWAFDPRDYSRRFVVEILGDGVALAWIKADMHVAELLRQGHGDGCHGFLLRLDPRVRVDCYELLLANGEHVVAHCPGLAAPMTSVRAAFSAGSVRWRGGLRLSGTIRGQPGNRDTTLSVEAYDGSRRIDAALTLHPGVDPDGGEYQFDLSLPDEMADGNLHLLRILSAAGVALEGSPIPVLVHHAGFQGLADGFGRRSRKTDVESWPRLAFLDRVIPASLPFDSHRVWLRDFADDNAYDEVDSALTLGVIIIGRSGSEATLASLWRQRGNFSIRAVVLDVESAERPCFSQADWRAACSDLAATTVAATPAATLLIRSGAELKSFACLALAASFALVDDGGERASLCVGDHELVGVDGTRLPSFGPAFDYERLLSQGYAEGFFALRDLPEIAGDPGELISSYDVLLAALEDAEAKTRRIVQIPRILASVPRLATLAATTSLAAAVRRHFARIGEIAETEAGRGAAFPLVHVRRPRPEGEVAIIIPTRDRRDLLKSCLTSIRERTDHPDYRVVIVDNGSREQETRDYFRELSRQGVVVLRDDGTFNYARLNNLAVREINSPFSCLLNNDVEVLAVNWLAEMQSFFSRQSVGGVGAKLIWPNGMLQHGGVVLGINFAAGHAYDRYLAGEPGYGDGILAARECSALTAACLLVRREDFLGIGGFDETAFPVAFNDVDLCLKLRKAGKALIWSPRAQLLHRESASRASDRESPAKQARFEKELAELRRRWGHKLVADDYYSPNLNLDAYPFTGLALPPRDRAFRVSSVRF